MPANDIQFTYVYILISEKFPERHYIGCTSDLKKRFKKHNNGSVPHTSKFRPWQLHTAIAFKDIKKARNFERYLKSGSGREFSRRHF